MRWVGRSLARCFKSVSLLPAMSLFFSLVLAGLFAPAVSAQDESAIDADDWNGTWVVEGTFFSVAVEAQDGLLKITQVESLGFKWESKDGVIDGNIALIEVDYAGVEAVARVELVSADTALVTAASCKPELMVVCVLTKNRMAVFRKVQ